MVLLVHAHVGGQRVKGRRAGQWSYSYTRTLEVSGSKAVVQVSGPTRRSAGQRPSCRSVVLLVHAHVGGQRVKGRRAGQWSYSYTRTLEVSGSKAVVQVSGPTRTRARWRSAGQRPSCRSVVLLVHAHVGGQRVKGRRAGQWSYSYTRTLEVSGSKAVVQVSGPTRTRARWRSAGQRPSCRSVVLLVHAHVGGQRVKGRRAGQWSYSYTCTLEVSGSKAVVQVSGPTRRSAGQRPSCRSVVLLVHAHVGGQRVKGRRAGQWSYSYTRTLEVSGSKAVVQVSGPTRTRARWRSAGQRPSCRSVVLLVHAHVGGQRVKGRRAGQWSYSYTRTLEVSGSKAVVQVSGPTRTRARWRSAGQRPSCRSVVLLVHVHVGGQRVKGRRAGQWSYSYTRTLEVSGSKAVVQVSGPTRTRARWRSAGQRPSCRSVVLLVHAHVGGQRVKGRRAGQWSYSYTCRSVVLLVHVQVSGPTRTRAGQWSYSYTCRSVVLLVHVQVSGPTRTREVSGPTRTREVSGPTRTREVSGPTRTRVHLCREFNCFLIDDRR